MNPKHRPRRQIYNKQQLNKQTLINRQITGQRRQKKINIGKEIVKEIEKEENDIEMGDGQEKEKAGEEEKSIKTENEKGEKEEKKKQERLKLDAKTLLYNADNGLRKFYEVITNTEFKSQDNTKNLDKLINLTRNWHYMLFPNYDFDYFTNKLISLGKQAPTRAYMSRVRRIYKGEEDWDVIYNEQAQILGKASIMNGQKEFTNPNPTNENKEKKEENKEKKEENKENKENKEKKDENNSNKNNNVNETKEMVYNAEDQGIIQDLILNDENLEEKDKKENKNEKNDKNDKNDKDMNDPYEVKDSDFDNFPEDYDPEAEYEQRNLVSNLNNTSKHESLLNSHENKLKNMNFATESKNSLPSGMEIDGNERPILKQNLNLEEKRTSDQIFGANDENNENLEPESMKKKMIIEN